MRVLWKIQTFERRTNERSEKWVHLDTATLEPVLRHKVELCLERHDGVSREILRYRYLFQDEVDSVQQHWNADQHDEYPRIACVSDYAEDDAGKEVSLTEIARIVTGNEDVLVVPPGMRPHDIQFYYLAKNTPLPENPLDHIHLTQQEIDTLACFLRDATELKRERFYLNPPSLHAQGAQQWIETIPVENIRSFVIVFRKMYMTGEPGNYLKACDAYTQHFLNKRVTDWVSAEKQVYEEFLSKPACLFPGLGPPYSFTNKRLIDAFLNTRFVHQPQERRIKQFRDCLQEVGNADRMEFAFYNAMLELARHYSALQWVLSNELPAYLNHTGAGPSFESPPFVNEGGRGSRPTKEEAEARQLHEFAEKLGYELWTNAGKPEGELPGYVARAKSSLRE